MNTLLVAARKPLLLAVPVVAIITGLLVHPWMLPLGIVVYVVSVLLASRDASLLQASQQRKRREGITSPLFAAKISEIERSQQEVERALARVGGPVAARLSQSVQPQTRALVEQAYTLARKGQDIERFLSRVNDQHIQKQIDQIDARIDKSTDQYTIDQLQGTRKALVEQLNSAQVLQTYIGRINSQLDNIDANLDAMPAQFLRMRASDVDANMASEEVANHLNDLNADMTAFVGMLDTALHQTQAGAP
jgi:archaellum component FlaC